MALFTYLRLVVWAKRLALATERLADNSDEALAILQRLHPLRPTERKATDFSVADPAEWNRQWLEEHPQYSRDEDE